MSGHTPKDLRRYAVVFSQEKNQERNEFEASGKTEGAPDERFIEAWSTFLEKSFPDGLEEDDMTYCEFTENGMHIVCVSALAECLEEDMAAWGVEFVIDVKDLNPRALDSVLGVRPQCEVQDPVLSY